MVESSNIISLNNYRSLDDRFQQAMRVIDQFDIYAHADQSEHVREKELVAISKDILKDLRDIKALNIKSEESNSAVFLTLHSYSSFCFSQKKFPSAQAVDSNLTQKNIKMFKDSVFNYLQDRVDRMQCHV